MILNKTIQINQNQNDNQATVKLSLYQDTNYVYIHSYTDFKTVKYYK